MAALFAMSSAALLAARRFAPKSAARSLSSTVQVGGHGGAIWSHFTTAPDTPKGFTLRTAWDEQKNPTGATTILEQWEAGSEEPPHSHPGDDATIVIEGKMAVQFFTKDAAGKLVKDGMPLILTAGQTGYIAANRIHDAKYIEKCKLVYVHSGGFGFHGH
jgi:hypothetical protein